MPQWTRFRRFFGLEPKVDIDAELGFHLEMRIRELIESGETPERARELALQRFDDTKAPFLLTPVEAGSPVVRIDAASVIEGHSGTRAARFTATLSMASSQPITVSYSTAHGSADDADYQAASGTLTVDAGQTSKTISVLVNGDRAGEDNETLTVNLGLVAGSAVIGELALTESG